MFRTGSSRSTSTCRVLKATGPPGGPAEGRVPARSSAAISAGRSGAPTGPPSRSSAPVPSGREERTAVSATSCRSPRVEPGAVAGWSPDLRAGDRGRRPCAGSVADGTVHDGPEQPRPTHDAWCAMSVPREGDIPDPAPSRSAGRPATQPRTRQGGTDLLVAGAVLLPLGLLGLGIFVASAATGVPLADQPLVGLLAFLVFGGGCGSVRLGLRRRPRAGRAEEPVRGATPAAGRPG